MIRALGDRITDAVEAAGLAPLDGAAIDRLSAYISLILRWNTRINLSAIRDEDGIISRHIIESVEVTGSLPKGISTLLDFGSGAGLPGIPIAICRPEITVTLAESQNKKAAFLMEAVRALGLNSKVHSGRAEELKSLFDCVTMRAVDKMAAAVSSATELVAPNGWLALMTTAAGLEELKVAAGSGFVWTDVLPLTWSDARTLALGKKISSQG
jgi:16S rRNA (guanine527-N7)-methyltransferase